MKSRIHAIDLFCGAGGLTAGLISSGIRVVAGIDADPVCEFAYQANHPNSKYVCRDVRKVTSADLSSLWGNAEYRLLAGCAPCQPFSTFSQGKDNSRDSRWTLLNEFSRLVKATKPEFVTMENVPSLAKTNVFDNFVSELESDGYSVQTNLVNCAEYGVPQQRNRLVVLASKPKFRVPHLTNFKKAKISVKNAISDLPPIKAGEQSVNDPLHRAASLSPLNTKRIEASKPGGTWRDWPTELRAECHRQEKGDGYIAVYGRMEWDKPAPTMTTQCYNYGSGRFGHPEQKRPISLREAALLQGFPKEFRFNDSATPISTREIARMIGNAVPPPLGAVIGQAFNKSIS